MVTKVVPGQLIASQDAAQVARDASTRIAKVLRAAVAKGGRATLALSGGRTPWDTYKLLAREAGVDWSKVHVFWVDERAVPPTDDRSNYRGAKETLIDGAGIAPDLVHRMPAESADRDAAARDYETAIRATLELDGDGVPAFDAVVLGIGDDGHTASLFPGEPTVDITERLVAAVPAKGAREARLTLTPVAIEHARNLFILAVGAAKRAPLERAWLAQGDVHETPARVVRGCHGVVTWLIDKAAGGL